VVVERLQTNDTAGIELNAAANLLGLEEPQQVREPFAT
jgi:hypothetical protein